MDNINRHVLRLRQLALAAKAAADTEDYAIDAGNEGDVPARDPASLQRVELVRVTSSDMEIMTPHLVTAAQVGEFLLLQEILLVKAQWTLSGGGQMLNGIRA